MSGTRNGRHRNRLHFKKPMEVTGMDKSNRQREAADSRPNTGSPSICEQPFGKTKSGEAAALYILTNGNGMRACISDFGATLVSLLVPDRTGQSQNIVLGFDDLKDYERDGPYFGATVGRYANRIAHGRFTLDGIEYQLPVNNGPNSLHGGITGFDKRLWQAVARMSPKGPELVLSCTSMDGEEGYPGEVKLQVTYTLRHDNALAIRYAAVTDKPTVIALTNHSYFNLSGDFSKPVLSDTLQINADFFTPVDSVQIPTGEIRSVCSTPFDFRHPMTVGKKIDSPDEQIAFGSGYDHNWVLRKPFSGALAHAATLTNQSSGRSLTVWTTEPGVQVYTANYLDGRPDSTVFGRRCGICLETQHFPDSPNKPHFPSTILRPGVPFESETVFQFDIE